MVSSNTTSREFTRTPLEDNAAAVLPLILEGMSLTKIAERFGTSREAVSLFKDRHKAELQTQRAVIGRVIEDYAIASKVQRIADYDEIRAIMRSEAVSLPVTLEETRYGVKRRPNEAFNTWRQVNQQAAEELDQLPRAGITVNNQNVVIVKQVTGSDKALT